jgi:1-aminocyclopropane-1-carboxylate deaminase
LKTINQFLFTKNNIHVTIKREDLIHPIVSGNKFRKLKYNLVEAKNQNKTKLLTFGGAFSNHIAAVAYAGKENGFETIGAIRGDELLDKIQENPTLKFAQECGMKFEFVTRNQYQNKNSQDFLEYLKTKFGDFYTIPEGGTNELAIKGCKEILTNEDSEFDYICVCVGTGGTISGLINSSKPNQKILGFPALKGDFLNDEIRTFAKNNNWHLITDFHFGGYGKITDELIDFMNDFSNQYKILLDPIYTAKMVFGVIDLINKNYFAENCKILLIHSGGLQGINGINNLLKKKNKTLINTNV